MPPVLIAFTQVVVVFVAFFNLASCFEDGEILCLEQVGQTVCRVDLS